MASRRNRNLSPVRSGGLPRSVWGLLLLAAVVGGCSEVTMGSTVGGVWQGELVAVPGADQIFGPVSMVSVGANTRITIEVNDGPPSSALGWLVRVGACDETGQLLAPPSSFTFIETDASGAGAQEILVGGGLPLEAQFAAGVFSDIDLSELLACADLFPIDG